MADTGFIKYMRSEEAEYLLRYPNANHLFSVMALRARRTDHPLNGLKAGQCFLGDYSEIGLTRQQYRTAQKQLSEWNLATFKGTNKGTIGTIINSRVYDINVDDGNQQPTNKQPASNQQATTNKECKKERKEKDPSDASMPDAPKSKYCEEFEFMWKERPRREGGDSKALAYKKCKAQIKKGATWRELAEGLRRYFSYCKAKNKLHTEFVMQMSTFFGPNDHFREEWIVRQEVKPEQDKVSPSEEFRQSLRGQGREVNF